MSADQPKPAHTGGTPAGLRARGLTVRFPGQSVPALNDVDLGVEAGRVLALLGPSGCGKSTALRVIAGLQEADGQVTYDAADLTRVPAHRRGFSLMFQDGQLFGHLDVFENVAYGLRRRHTPRVEIENRVRELLELIGLEGYERRSPATLSGGQQQRVALARALAPRPRLLLLDEPLSALDRGLRERLAVELREIMRAEGATALFVTHDHDEALTVADDVALMREGRVIQAGSAREVWQHPVDAEAARFLGYATVIEASTAQALGLGGTRWALRRTAWRVADPGESAWDAEILRMRGSGDLLDVTLRLPTLAGTVVESAFLAGHDASPWQVGDVVRVALDPSRAVRVQ